jgi:hypothetical protein
MTDYPEQESRGIDVRDGDTVRVTRHVIAPDGSERQVADWTGRILDSTYEDGKLTGFEHSTAGHLGLRTCSLGREGHLRTTVERLQPEMDREAGS